MSPRTEQKVQTREEILKSATCLLRQRGIGATGVAEVMKGAGLTVGGFYAHFGSKDALISEAFVAAATEAHTQRLAPAETATLADVVAKYASPNHRDHPAEGCPIPAVLSEIAGQSDEVRETFRKAIEGLVGRLSDLSGDATDAQARRDAAAAVALMVGALTLSRALAGSPLSNELLAAAGAHAHDAFAPPKRAKRPRGKKEK
jgi:TetR/AcrR family transcriptional repressor of nem operon